jgi:lipopolysaccharide/colanic/teichoic acid biosynthesis glycosyltransferase
LIYRKFVKRLLDLAVSLAALAVLSPALLALWALVRVKLGRPAIFRQERPGRGGRLFTMYKFRTMNDKAGPDGAPLPDAMRLTPFGSALRSLSLDELPELVNVLKGDMSLIGPRPLLAKYLPLYSGEQMKRHLERPGLTGWAQVNGRNTISWEDKFAYDVWYVENLSAALDFKILAKTVSAVLKREGISHEGSATMKEFKGSPPDGPPGGGGAPPDG